MKSRQALPFREKCEVFLLHGKNQILAQDRGSYLMFAGGGVDPDETLEATAKREALEETGAVIKGPLNFICTVDFVWFPEWANNSKRRQRYENFQGERVHIFVGKASKIGRATSDEGDHWIGRKTMSISRCLDLVTKYGASDHPNTYAYRIAQISAINSLKLLQ